MNFKICCIANISEAEMAISRGAQMLGLVGPMPSGPGPIEIDTAHEVVRFINNRAASFYLTSKTSLQNIADEYRLVGSSHIQLTDQTSYETRAALKQEFPKVKIVQVLHVQNNDALNLVDSYCTESDFLLLDSGAPTKKVKELGGTGRTHDWQLSRQIVEQASVPVFLAGGLHSGNILKAISIVQPFGLDVCSGVRTNGRLDPVKLDAFIDALS